METTKVEHFVIESASRRSAKEKPANFASESKGLTPECSATCSNVKHTRPALCWSVSWTTSSAGKSDLSKSILT